MTCPETPGSLGERGEAEGRVARPGLAEGDTGTRRVLREWLSTRGLPPLHFMTEAELGSLGALRAIAGVFGGGSPIRLIARALVMAVRREARRLLGKQ
jgi:hypothetical protein